MVDGILTEGGAGRPADHAQTGRRAAGSRALRCARCGEAFGCGARDAGCWCQDYPPLPAEAIDAGSDCLCPSCLLGVHVDRALSAKTMPLGALGQVADLARRIALAQHTLEPRLDRAAMLVFAADHGITAEAVSAYPREVTWQMVENFRRGGAAINVFCRAQGLPLWVVDAGVDHDFGPAAQDGGQQAGQTRFLSTSMGPGTGNFLHGHAMALEQATEALARGAGVVRDLLQATHAQAIGFGEMGIGNTTSASALCCRLLGLSPLELVGAGTGLDEAGIVHKRAVVERALLRHADAHTPLAVLAALGGFEIAQMAGAMLESARQQLLIVVDGFISTAALVVARAMMPEVMRQAIFAHCSGERGHRHVLEALGAEPVLQLGMRLGEGSAAALVMPLLRSAAAMLSEMASFESAAVSRAGR